MKTPENVERRFEILQKVISPLMDESMMSSYISSRADHHITEPYKNGRYLDALARILNIQDPCSAVVQVGEMLYITFNHVEEKINKVALGIINSSIDINVEAVLIKILTKR